MTDLKASAQRVQETVATAGLACQVIQLPASTRSAREAAEALGCQVAQIAKSIVFEAQCSGRGVLVIASGVNRISESIIGEHLGEQVRKASPEFVREKTGFAIGGVPPCAHLTRMVTYIDRDLLQMQELWAAAGTPNAVFQLAPQDLVRLTQGLITAVS